MSILVIVGLFLAGLLAGIEFVVRYGIHPALAALPDREHLLARYQVVRFVRVLTPAVMLPSVLVAIAVLVFGGAGAGLPFRWAGVIAYVAFLLLAFLGTVPINSRFFDWDLASPPTDWRDIIRRWALIDIFRSSAAILAFAFFLVAALLG